MGRWQQRNDGQGGYNYKSIGGKRATSKALWGQGRDTTREGNVKKRDGSNNSAMGRQQQQ
jgi:hypothetical protein